MRFALVNSVRSEASPGLVGQCPACSAQVIAKCGTRRVWHWSHRGERNCDPWREPETEWHRAWKNLFHSDWQEVRHVDYTGERHIADIKTGAGLVIEIQHSAIVGNEMNAREAFYKEMVWVVDATRLKRDRPRLEEGIRLWLTSIGAGYFITQSPENCFPEAWLNRKVPVLFDIEALSGFNEGAPGRNSRLWCLLPGRVAGYAVAAIVSRRQFAEIAQQRARIFACREIFQVVGEFLRIRQRAAQLPVVLPTHRRFKPWRRRTARF